jgi:peptidoglycan/LPS O-acetylase OafA/YrhL
MWNGAGWTLSVEALFYAIFPLVVVVAVRLRRHPIAIALALIAADFGVLWALRWQWVPNQFPMLFLPLFFAGVGLSRLASRGVRVRPRWMLVATALTGVSLTFVMPQVPLFNLFLYHLWFPLWFAILILGCVQPPRWYAWLSWTPLVLLGEVSYGVYIYQGPVSSLYQRVLGLDPGSTFPHLLGYVCVLVLIAWASYHYVEEPLRRLGKWQAPARERGERGSLCPAMAEPAQRR